jgi:hypothetical protein
MSAPSDVVAGRMSAVAAHERAAETHKRAADFYERAAVHDREHGWEEMALRMEEHADNERDAAAAEQEKADRGREPSASPKSPRPVRIPPHASNARTA